MLLKFLFFTLILISKNDCDDSFIRYKSQDIPCSILSTDRMWIQCTINQSDPLKFFSATSFTNLNIEFVPLSTENLTLPSKFFMNENSFSNYDLVVFDTTHNSQLKQINIFIDTFSNLFSTKIHFILRDCGYPIVEIERHTFHYSIIQQIFITYHNRSRTVSLKDYFSEECLIDEKIVFKNENENNLVLTEFYSLNKNKQLRLTKLFINGSLLCVVSLLTGMMMCLVNRMIVSSSSDMIQKSRTSSELSTPVISPIP